MNDQTPTPNGKGGFNPFRILKESIRAVPAMKYALAVMGLVAVVAVVTVWRVSYSVAIFGAIIILGLMVPVLVFAKLTKAAPKYFLRPAQVFMWAFVALTIVTAFCLFTAAAFRQPRALYELIFARSAATATPQDKIGSSAKSSPPKFVARYVYKADETARTEFETEAEPPIEHLDEFLTLKRLAYGTANENDRAFQVDLLIKNTNPKPIFLDLDKRFFSMDDDKGRSAELLYFCCDAKGVLLAAGEERSVQLFFKDTGWYGKHISSNVLYVRVRGFSPVVSAAWKTHALPTGD